MIKNLSILTLKYFFFSLASLEKAKQSIHRHISLVQIIINMEVLLREFLGQADLKKAQAFHIFELIKIIIVCKDTDCILIGF